MGKKANLVGKKFGKLTVAQYAETISGKQYWICDCECGNRVTVETSNLTSGNSKSCGCSRRASLVKRNTTHGLSKTKTYKYWAELIKRFHKKKIELSQSWTVYEQFYKDMGEKPEGMALGRKNILEPFYCDNCSWIPEKDIETPRPSSTIIQYNGEAHTFTGWEKVTGIKRGVLSCRYKNGLRPPELFQKAKDAEEINIEGHVISSGRSLKDNKFILHENNEYHAIMQDGTIFKISVEDYNLINKFHWWANRQGYIETMATIDGKKKRLFAHRLIMREFGDWKKTQIDHINQDKSDNRRCNLRFCTCSDNQINRGIRKDSTTNVTGVTRDGNSWRASIQGRHIGSFKTKEEAIKARAKEEVKIYGEFSKYATEK